MALGPDNVSFSVDDRHRVAGFRNWFRGLFHAHHHFSPEQVLAEAKEIDPRLQPKAPMKSDNIDPALMLEFRSMGFLHAQEITAETHPELYLGWQELCRRGGFQKPLQLIVTDNPDPNAIDASESEVVMSTGLLKMLSFRELLSVLGHELGHAKHDAKSNKRPLTDGAGVIAGGLLGNIIGHGVEDRFYPMERRVAGDIELTIKKKPGFLIGGLFQIGKFALTVGGALTGWMIAHQFSVKPSELRADREGVAISGDPEALISAFTKMKQMSAHQSGWKQFWRYAWSGYPTFDERINQIKNTAVPADRQPVYKMIDMLAQAPVPPEVEAARKQQSAGPASKVGKIDKSERIIYVPETSLLH